MKTLVVANQKGGVGKTALVVNLAWDFAERSLRVAVLDLDVQGNCSFTLGQSGATATGIPASTILLAGADGNAFPPAAAGITLFPGDNKLQSVESLDAGQVAANLRGGLSGMAAAGYDVCLIDSPAAFGVRFMAGLLAADFILAPIELEAYSIQGIKRLVTTVAAARKLNPAVRFLGMLANKVDGRNHRHREHRAQLQAAYADLLVPVAIGLRGSVAEALVSGRPVWENKKTAARAAARELRQAADWIAREMGLSAHVPEGSAPAGKKPGAAVAPYLPST